MFDLRQHTHLLVVAGSRAYGLHTDTSDVDLKGVAVPPASVLFSPFRTFEQADSPAEMAVYAVDLSPEERAISQRTKLEGSVYALRKFIGLAAGANPNILDVLFCRDAEVRIATPIGEALREARGSFISLACRHTYAGYAASQLGRIERHHRWHTQGPTEVPTRADYDLPDAPLLPRVQLEAAEAAVRRQILAWDVDFSALPDAEREALQTAIARSLAEQGLAADRARFEAAANKVGLDDNLIEVMRRERAFRAAVAEHKRYRTWVKKRNPQRAALEAAHGYDTKHGAHLVRLLRMAHEILTTGQVNVWRDGIDRDELLAIRGGAWSYEALVDWTNTQRARIDALGPDDIVVPRAVDKAAIDAHCVQLMERVAGG